jgi:hypothetical protein
VSIFEELRALDDRDEPRTLRFASSNLPLWPYVRWIVFMAAQDAALGTQLGFATSVPRTIRQRVELLLRSQLRGPLSVRRSFDIVNVGSSAGLVLQREGRWFDRINDYFAMELPDRTLVLDMALNGVYKTPRFPPHVRAFDQLDIMAGVAARLARPNGRDVATIDRMVEFVRERCPVTLPDALLEQARATLLHWAVRLPILRSLYARFFARIRPRILFIEGASYGAFAHVCTWARDAGIATGELQHGVIANAHLGYNYGDRALADAATWLPRYLLLYGELWKRDVRTPSETVAVGCPHFSEMARRAPRGADATVLTVSQGLCTELMVRLTSTLARRFPRRRFVFRLHPGEVPFRERYASLAELSNIEISDKGDIYRLFQQADVVIGHSSTALFEAAGVGLPVLIYDDEIARLTIPRHVGTWFRSADELASLVEAPPSLAFEPEQFFAPDWRERYRQFIARVA